MEKVVAFFKDEAGATAVEYAIMVGLIAAVVIMAVRTLGERTSAGYETVTSQMP